MQCANLLAGRGRRPRCRHTRRYAPNGSVLPLRLVRFASLVALACFAEKSRDRMPENPSRQQHSAQYLGCHCVLHVKASSGILGVLSRLVKRWCGNILESVTWHVARVKRPHVARTPSVYRREFQQDSRSSPLCCRRSRHAGVANQGEPWGSPPLRPYRYHC